MSDREIPLSEPPLPASKPHRRGPVGSTDCHFHIFGPENEYPLSPARGYTPHPEANIKVYQEMADTIGITRMIIVNPTPYRLDHECTINSLKVFGRENAKAVAVINKDTTQEQLKRYTDAGFVAARVNNVNAGTTRVEEMDDVIRLIEPLGWHLEVYVEGEELPALEQKLLKLPMKVVIDHMGRIPTSRGIDAPEFKCLLRLLESGKVWVKMCGYRSSVEMPPYHDTIVPARKIIATAPERCVWGTDWPHPRRSGPYMIDDGKILDLLGEWAPDDEQYKRILVDNPAELYGFSSA